MQMTADAAGVDRDVELVGRMIDAYNARDLEAVLGLLHPDITVVPTPGFLAPGIEYHGHAGFRAITEDLNALFSSMQIRPDAVRRVGEHVLVVWTALQLRRGAPGPTPRKAIHLFGFENGLIRRIEGFRSEEDAVDAANRLRPIAITEQYLAAIGRRDAEAMVAVCHPDVQVFPSQSLVPAGTTYTGHDGIRSMVAVGYDRWGYYAVESVSLRETGGRVEAHIVLARGETEATAGRFELVVLHTFEGDKIRLIEGFSRPFGEPDPHPSGDEYRTLFDALRDPAYLVDDDCRLIDANAAAEQSGVSAAQRGRPLADLVPGLPMLRGDRWQELLAEGQLCQDLGPEVGELRVKARFLPHRHLVIIRTDPADREPAEPVLTAREREIFRLLALGLSGKDIARQLFLSPDTVRTHVQNGVSRLGARTRGQAIAIALTRGEISL